MAPVIDQGWASPGPPAPHPPTPLAAPTVIGAVMAEKKYTLVSPDGREYTTTDRTEVTSLKARGYSEKKPAAKEPVATKSSK